MSVTGLSRGLSQVGKYILSRKGQEREVKNRLMLENLKNQMWQRRLREETERQSLYQQRLLEQYKANQAAEVEKQRIKADYDAEQERLKRERENDPNSIDYKIKQERLRKLQKEIANIGKAKPTSTRYITAKERTINKILNKKEEDRTDQEKAWLKNYFLGKESTDIKSLLLEELNQDENDPLGIR